MAGVVAGVVARVVATSEAPELEVRPPAANSYHAARAANGVARPTGHQSRAAGKLPTGPQSPTHSAGVGKPPFQAVLEESEGPGKATRHP